MKNNPFAVPFRGFLGLHYRFSSLRHLGRAHHADERAVVVGRVLRALPDGFTEHELEVGGEVDPVEEHLGRRVVTLDDGRVALEAALARRGAIGAQRAFFLAVGVAEGLQEKSKIR